MAIDLDTEIITSTAVTLGNASDRSVAEDLSADLLGGAPAPKEQVTAPSEDQVTNSDGATGGVQARDEGAPPPVAVSATAQMCLPGAGETTRCPSAIRAITIIIIICGRYPYRCLHRW